MTSLFSSLRRGSAVTSSLDIPVLVLMFEQLRASLGTTKHDHDLDALVDRLGAVLRYDPASRLRKLQSLVGHLKTVHRGIRLAQGSRVSQRPFSSPALPVLPAAEFIYSNFCSPNCQLADRQLASIKLRGATIDKLSSKLGIGAGRQDLDLLACIFGIVATIASRGPTVAQTVIRDAKDYLSILLGTPVGSKADICTQAQATGFCCECHRSSTPPRTTSASTVVDECKDLVATRSTEAPAATTKAGETVSFRISNEDGSGAGCVPKAAHAGDVVPVRVNDGQRLSDLGRSPPSHRQASVADVTIHPTAPKIPPPAPLLTGARHHPTASDPSPPSGPVPPPPPPPLIVQQGANFIRKMPLVTFAPPTTATIWGTPLSASLEDLFPPSSISALRRTFGTTTKTTGHRTRTTPNAPERPKLSQQTSQNIMIALTKTWKSKPEELVAAICAADASNLSRAVLEAISEIRIKEDDAKIIAELADKVSNGSQRQEDLNIAERFLIAAAREPHYHRARSHLLTLLSVPATIDDQVKSCNKINAGLKAIAKSHSLTVLARSSSALIARLEDRVAAGRLGIRFEELQRMGGVKCADQSRSLLEFLLFEVPRAGHIVGELQDVAIAKGSEIANVQVARTEVIKNMGEIGAFCSELGTEENLRVNLEDMMESCRAEVGRLDAAITATEATRLVTAVDHLGEPALTSDQILGAAQCLVKEVNAAIKAIKASAALEQQRNLSRRMTAPAGAKQSATSSREGGEVRRRSMPARGSGASSGGRGDQGASQYDALLASIRARRTDDASEQEQEEPGATEARSRKAQH